MGFLKRWEENVKAVWEEAVSRVKAWEGQEIKCVPVQGGKTNWDYKVTVGEVSAFLKVPGEETDFIDRDSCYVANRIAKQCGAGPAVLYYFDDTGVLFSEWLEGYRQLKFGDVYEREIFEKMICGIRKFHGMEEVLPLLETVFDQTREMVSRIKDGKYLPPWHDRMLYLMQKIEEAFAYAEFEVTPCHNDFWTNNIMYNEEKDDLKIVDYEYASMGDPYYDLAVLSVNNFLTEEMDAWMSKVYHDGKEDPIGFARLKLNKIAADIKWVYWSLYREKRSELLDYMGWYGPKIARLQHMWTDPRVDVWLNLLKGKSPFYKK